MSRHYYFAATLPSLQFGAQPPLSSGEFLERAARYLEAGELACLGGLSLADSLPLFGEAQVASRHRVWDKALRNELVRLRAKRLGKGAEAWLRPEEEYGPAAIRAAQAAFQASSPLEGEIAIEKERWALLDDLAPFQSFDFESLSAYLLKLHILERLASFEVGRGESLYRETYAAILGAAGTSSETGVKA